MFDGVFNDLIKDKSDKSHNDGDKKSVKNIKTLDPRPDLSRDTILWQQMLAGSQDRDPSGELYAALLYMRTKGTVLRCIPSNGGGKKYAYVLKPTFDPSGNDGWTDINEYEREKHLVLDPVCKRLIELLKKM